MKVEKKHINGSFLSEEVSMTLEGHSFLSKYFSGNYLTT